MAALPSAASAAAAANQSSAGRRRIQQQRTTRAASAARTRLEADTRRINGRKVPVLYGGDASYDDINHEEGKIKFNIISLIICVNRG